MNSPTPNDPVIREATIHVTVESFTYDAEKLIELAGRTAYKSFNRMSEESARPFIRRIVASGHKSVIEHASATFRISGISRACSHQLVRHRIASFTQESQRYVKQNNMAVVIPESIRADPERSRVYHTCIADMAKAYDTLLQMGTIPEDARFLLPNASATTVVMTANFREWRHFLEVRGDPHAQWEIRKVAIYIRNALYAIAPAVFEDYRVIENPQTGDKWIVRMAASDGTGST